jgi:hypothetical protein
MPTHYYSMSFYPRMLKLSMIYVSHLRSSVLQFVDDVKENPPHYKFTDTSHAYIPFATSHEKYFVTIA